MKLRPTIQAIVHASTSMEASPLPFEPQAKNIVPRPRPAATTSQVWYLALAFDTYRLSPYHRARSSSLQRTVSCYPRKGELVARLLGATPPRQQQNQTESAFATTFAFRACPCPCPPSTSGRFCPLHSGQLSPTNNSVPRPTATCLKPP